MQIRINGKLAALKKGTSFDYISENRLFSGSDGYTLSITFPLRGCPQNLTIFGHINRQDVMAGKVIFDCEIRDKGFYKFGSITITEINESEVKTQFLEGRSEQNFNTTFDTIYINELDLGAPKVYLPSSVTPAQAWDPITQQYESVALPWWNDSSDGLAHNFADFKNGKYEWSETTTDLTWQPYLLFITKKICEAVGYTADFTKWEEAEQYKYLLICNVLPGAWDIAGYARALPHWTVDEYFEKLELFLNGEFTIDHRQKRISFDFTQNILQDIRPIELRQVVDEHSVEIYVEDEQCEYLEAKNIVYKEQDHEMWKYYSCDWFIKAWKNNVVSYATLSELLSKNKGYKSWDGRTMRGSNLNNLLYAADVDMYFILRAISRVENGQDAWGHKRYIYTVIPQPINLFGGRIVDEREDADEVEIEFVPARIDHTEEKYGFCIFMSFSGYSESRVYIRDYDYDAFTGTGVQSRLLAGASEKKAEYYSSIYVAYWDGAVPMDGKLPHPFVENIVIAENWESYYQPHFSLRINDRLAGSHRPVHKVNPKMKTTFKFLSDKIPDVRSLFYIRGKRYICEKITATFTEDGMSQLLSGIFWPLMD